MVVESLENIWDAVEDQPRGGRAPQNPWRTCSNAVLAACIAEAATLPIEVAKVRLQLQKATQRTVAPQYGGLVGTLWSIYRQERVPGLFKGFEAGMHKQILYAGLRLGLYDHFTSDEHASLPTKMAYATATTGVGIVVANPSDVVQVKYMAYSARAPQPVSAAPQPQQHHAHSTPPPHALPVAAAPPQRRGFSAAALSVPPAQGQCPHSVAIGRGSGGAAPLVGRVDLAQTHGHRMHRFLYHDHRRRLHGSGGAHSASAVARGFGSGPRAATGAPLRSARQAYYVISKEEGFFRGLYRGFSVNFACSGIQGATEICTYDLTKRQLLDGLGFPDEAPVHLASGMMAGLVATLLSNPFDVVATRLMAGKTGQAVDENSVVKVVTKLWKHEGVLGFYKGFGPNILRIGSFNVIMWLSYEQIRRLTLW